MNRCIPLKQPPPGPCAQVRLPPVSWVNFTMHETQFLGNDVPWGAWRSTWKAILLASGVPHDGSTDPARFLLSEHDDHALAVLLRTTISPDLIAIPELVNCVTGKPIFSWASRYWGGEGNFEIFYASQLSKEEAARFSVDGKSLEVVEDEHEGDTESED